jgi:hypothetical protein
MATNIVLLRVSILSVVEFFMILFELYDIKTSSITEPMIKNDKVVAMSFDFIVFSILHPL